MRCDGFTVTRLDSKPQFPLENEHVLPQNGHGLLVKVLNRREGFEEYEDSIESALCASLDEERFI